MVFNNITEYAIWVYFGVAKFLALFLFVWTLTYAFMRLFRKLSDIIIKRFKIVDKDGFVLEALTIIINAPLIYQFINTPTLFIWAATTAWNSAEVQNYIATLPVQEFRQSDLTASNVVYIVLITALIIGMLYAFCIALKEIINLTEIKRRALC